jgi:outer membrane protein
MKRALGIVLALGLLALSGLPLAQKKAVPSRIGFIDAETVIQAHPGYPAVAELQKKADAELKPILEKLKPLEAKLASGQASAKERQDYQVLSEAAKKVRDKWAPKIKEKLDPLIKEIDQVVAKVARENGFAVVMNRRVAASSNLVVYADPATDLTQAVVEALKELKP